MATPNFKRIKIAGEVVGIPLRAATGRKKLWMGGESKTIEFVICAANDDDLRRVWHYIFDIVMKQSMLSSVVLIEDKE